MAKHNKVNVNFVAWFFTLCLFSVFLIINISRNKHVRDSSFHRLGKLEINIDGWSISHFVMYALVGYTYPGKVWPFVLFGVGFEFLEEFSGMFSRQLGKQKSALVKSSGDKDYWFGQLSDPVVNITGLLVGQSLGRRYNTSGVDTKGHIFETCLLLTNFAIMWFAVSETDKQFNISKSIKDIYLDGKKGIEKDISNVIDYLAH